MSKKAETLFIIDGHSLLYKSYYGLINRPLRDKQGMNTSALYGFVRTLLRLEREEQPDHLICAFDTPKPTFRHEMYKEYKAHRPETPEELSKQIPRIFPLLDMGKVAHISRVGYESDDLMASIVKQGRQRGWDCYLVTSDKDLMQLVGDGVWVYNSRRGGEVLIMGPVQVERHLGVPPRLVRDFLALTGDSSDNIPGVKGIGPKSAIALLRQFDGLDALLAGLDEIAKPRWRQLIEEHRQELELSCKLVELKSDLEINLGLFEGSYTGLDRAALNPLFKEMGFESLIAEAATNAPAQESPRPGTTDTPQENTAAQKGANRDYAMIAGIKELEAWLPELTKAKLLSLDCETDSLDPHSASLVGLSLSPRQGFARYLPFAHQGKGNLDRKKVLALLKPLLESAELPKAGSNLKYDTLVLRTHGIRLAGLCFDSMLAAYLLDPEGPHGLKAVAAKYLGRELVPIESLIGKGSKAITMAEIEAQAACDYACDDAEACQALAGVLVKKLKEAKLERLYNELEIPLVEVLVEMEVRGTRIDRDGLGRLARELVKELSRLTKEIYEEAGEEFNLDSPKQLRQILFEKKGIKPLKKNKTGPSTDSDVLSRLGAEHCLPRLVLEYRMHRKLQSTYVEALPLLVRERTGRLHTSFNQAVAATGRLSSSKPNLQNIPVRRELGREVRRCFIPSQRGWKLISADYSQVELRLLAHLSEDKRLLEAFKQEKDVHAQTARELFAAEGIPNTEKRRLAKVINYGLLYGMGARKLSRQTGLPFKTAQEYIERYFQRYSGVKEFIEQVRLEGRRLGYVKTLLDRRRPVPGLKSSSGLERSYAERIAVNTPIQGSAADIMKLAMIAVQRRLKGMETKMLLQVHDELLLEAPPNETERVVKLVREEMVGVFPLKVPLAVNVAVGDNWAEIH